MKAELANDCLAWGAMSAGMGYAQTEEFLSIMEVPMMSKKKYKKHEQKVGEVSVRR